MIAVTGAAGKVGRRVAEILLRAGQDVRALEHERSLGDLAGAGAGVVAGDLLSPGDVRKLLDGAEAALLVLPDNLADPRFAANRSAMSRAIVSVLREHPVGHVVLVSSVGADRSEGVGQIGGLHELEVLLAALPDVDVLALRSAWRMENLLAALPMVRAQGISGGVLSPDRAIPMIAARDVAADAAERLLRRDFSGKGVRTLVGPEDVTMERATAAIGERLGLPGLPYVRFPPGGVLQALRGAGMSDEGASLLVESQVALDEGRLDAGPDAARTGTRLHAFLDEALGRPAG